MTITIHPELETRLKVRAEADGLSVEAYVERLLRADQQAENELEALARAALESGEPIMPGPSYWSEQHRRLDERLEKTSAH